MDRWGDYWHFAALSAQRSFCDVFGAPMFTVDYGGNCYAAINFLRGIALEELDRNKLGVLDPNYPIVITIIATK